MLTTGVAIGVRAQPDPRASLPACYGAFLDIYIYIYAYVYLRIYRLYLVVCRVEGMCIIHVCGRMRVWTDRARKGVGAVHRCCVVSRSRKG